MVAVRLGGKRVGGGDVLVGGFFGDEVRVADDAAGKHTVVGDFLAFGALGFAFLVV